MRRVGGNLSSPLCSEYSDGAGGWPRLITPTRCKTEQPEHCRHVQDEENYA